MHGRDGVMPRSIFITHPYLVAVRSTKIAGLFPRRRGTGALSNMADTKDNPQQSSSEPELSTYARERREKRDKLRALGIDPYGAPTANVQPLADVRALHKAEFGQDGGPVVT